MSMTMKDLYHLRQEHIRKTGRAPKKLYLTRLQLMDLRTNRDYLMYASGWGSEPETIMGMEVIVGDPPM